MAYSTLSDFNELWNIDITQSGAYRKIAKLRNQQAFMNEFMNEVEMFFHSFRVEGVPDSGSERVIKEAVLWYGGYVPFKLYANSDSVLTLPGVPDGGGLNMYADYSAAHVFGADGFSRRIPLYRKGAERVEELAKTTGGVDYEEPLGVLVRASAKMFPFINYIYFYSFAISDTLRSLDVCRENIKRPFIITANKNLIPTITAQDQSVQNNERFVISTGSFPVDSIKLQPITGIPECISAASSLIDWYKNQIRELLGYDNLGGQVDKKGENLITAEVTYNDQATAARLDAMIDWLNYYHEQANRVLGTHLKAVKNNGSIYNNDIRRDGSERGGDLSSSDAGRTESNN